MLLFQWHVTDLLYCIARALQGSSRLLRKHMEPLVLKHRVDLVIGGHHHSYQRSVQPP
jgi:hypothetical protein